MPPKVKKLRRKYVASVIGAYGQISVGNPNLTVNERTNSNSELHAATPLVQRSLFQNTSPVDNKRSTDTIMSQLRHTTSDAEITLPQVQPKHTPSSDVSEQTPSITAGSDASSATRNGRRAGRCLKLDKMVKEEGKIKIVFNNNERKPAQHNPLFFEGVGVAVRTNVELEGVYEWNDLSRVEKELCRICLLQWFDIEDLASKRVNDLVDAHCQLAYKRWQNTLAVAYKKTLDAGIDPRFKSPSLEITHAKWQKVCDHLESEEFKERSKKNVENMAKLKYNDNAGKFLTLLSIRK